MKVEVKRVELLKILERLRPLLPARTYLPILQCVALTATKRGLGVVAGNLPIYVSENCPAVVAESGAACVQLKELLAFLGKVGGETVTLLVKPKNITEKRWGPVLDQAGGQVKDVLGKVQYADQDVTFKTSVFRALCSSPELDAEVELEFHPAKEYPTLPKIEGKSFVLEHFAEALKQVLPAISKEDSRPVLKCAYLNRIGRHTFLVTADGFQLARADVHARGQVENVLIDGEACTFLARNFDTVKVTVARNADGKANAILFEDNKRKLYASLNPDMTYPNYPTLIPTGGTLFQADRKKLIDALRFLNGNADGKTLEMVTKKGELTLAFGNARAKIPALKGSLKIGIDPNYLLSALCQLPNGTVTLYTKKTTSPIRLTGKGLIYVIMPMHVAKWEKPKLEKPKKVGEPVAAG